MGNENESFIDLTSIRLNGRVLDIGGGGEGVIARHSGDWVVAIDKRREELEETPDTGIKIVMDACELGFLDQSFDHVTFFYSILYMSDREIERGLCEAYRVLKPGGLLWIWDAVISISGGETEDLFLSPVEVKISKTCTVRTCYGVYGYGEQTPELLQACCEKAGFLPVKVDRGEHAFSLSMRKP